MPLKSLFQDMREEIGNISRRGFDVNFGNGFRSRSHRVVQDISVVATDAILQSRWDNIPPELLRDVLKKIEESESDWPLRKHVVACAGVCKTWRDVMKEIVKTPEIAGKITFPSSLKQPGPRNSLMQCYIKRNRRSQTYSLFLGLNPVSFESGKFLLAARKSRHATYTDYVITLNPDCVSKRSSSYFGNLRSNFLGTKFIIYDSQPPNAGARMIKCHSTRNVGFKQTVPKVSAENHPIASLSYELNSLGSRGPRRMNCTIHKVPAAAVEAKEAPSSSSMDSCLPVPILRSRSTHSENSMSRTQTASREDALVLKNKSPRWHEQLQCWCLNFNGRVTVASVKNFQLVAVAENGAEEEEIVVQFGKVGKDVFTMDYSYPISAFQAFAICLSSFDTKIACE